MERKATSRETAQSLREVVQDLDQEETREEMAVAVAEKPAEATAPQDQEAETSEEEVPKAVDHQAPEVLAAEEAIAPTQRNKSDSQIIKEF